GRFIDLYQPESVQAGEAAQFGFEPDEVYSLAQVERADGGPLLIDELPSAGRRAQRVARDDGAVDGQTDGRGIIGAVQGFEPVLPVGGYRWLVQHPLVRWRQGFDHIDRLAIERELGDPEVVFPAEVFGRPMLDVRLGQLCGGGAI